jgi:hypothetical protein
MPSECGETMMWVNRWNKEIFKYITQSKGWSGQLGDQDEPLLPDAGADGAEYGSVAAGS